MGWGRGSKHSPLTSSARERLWPQQRPWLKAAQEAGLLCLLLLRLLLLLELCGAAAWAALRCQYNCSWTALAHL